jgi:hypothetical protein
MSKSRNAKSYSVEEAATIKFAAVKEFRAMTKQQRLKNVHGILDNLRLVAMIATEILVLKKKELVAKAGANCEAFGSLLTSLPAAASEARALLEVINAAEGRMLVALANVSMNSAVSS